MLLISPAPLLLAALVITIGVAITLLAFHTVIVNFNVVTTLDFLIRLVLPPHRH